MNDNQKLGKRGEDAAEAFLLAKGYQILCRNYRYHKAEVDIISAISNQLVLVEVKTRKNNQFGKPEEFVSNRKQELFKEASEAYLLEYNLDYEVRFDVIAITGSHPPFQIEHFEDAF